MVYVDSSALIKRYIDEIGTDKFNIRLAEAVRAEDPILTSLLSYAEIHAALARKLKDRLLRVTEYHWAAARFESDWRTYLTRVELNQIVLALVPYLVKKHPLKAADAIQLASALWAVRAIQTGGTQRPLVFATSDKQLAGAAEYEQFEVFNPTAKA